MLSYTYLHKWSIYFSNFVFDFYPRIAEIFLPILITFYPGSHRFASYIAHVDRKYCSLFADNFWNTIVEQAIISDTGKYLKIYTMYLKICNKQVCFSHIITETCVKLCYETFFLNFSCNLYLRKCIYLIYFVVYLMILLSLLAFILFLLLLSSV